MKFKTYILIAVSGCCAAVLCSCGGNKTVESPSFTKVDSLTEVYLELQDSMLLSWNQMIYDDNQKLKAMRNLHHELTICNQFDPEQLKSIKDRLDQLSRLRYTQKSMANTDIVEEYDFASNSLISELVSLAESHASFSYSKALQKLVKDIVEADQRVENYRSEYDVVAMQYNKFIESNKTFMKEIDLSSAFEKKPLFQMASEAN